MSCLIAVAIAGLAGWYAGRRAVSDERTELLAAYTVRLEHALRQCGAGGEVDRLSVEHGLGEPLTGSEPWEHPSGASGRPCPDCGVRVVDDSLARADHMRACHGWPEAER